MTMHVAQLDCERAKDSERCLGFWQVESNGTRVDRSCTLCFNYQQVHENPYVISVASWDCGLRGSGFRSSRGCI